MTTAEVQTATCVRGPRTNVWEGLYLRIQKYGQLRKTVSFPTKKGKLWRHDLSLHLCLLFYSWARASIILSREGELGFKTTIPLLTHCLDLFNKRLKTTENR